MRARTALCFTFASTLFACASSAPDSSSREGSTIETPPMELPSLDVPSAPPSKLEPSPSGEPVAPYDGSKDLHAKDEPPHTPPKLLPTELDDLQLPDVVSPAPTEAEWLAAKRLRTTSFDCKARFVREWTTIVCSLGPMGSIEPFGVVRVLAGDEKDVGTWTWIPKPKSDQDPTEVFVAAVFPVRKGDRRILEITFEQHGAKPTFDRPAAFTISELWLDGMPSPEISVTR